MNRPPLEVADIVRCAGPLFVERSRRWITWQHQKILLAIARCRTAALGGHRDHCSDCGYSAISYNSCRNRHCPKCQGNGIFRGKFVAGLKNAFQSGALQFHGHLLPLTEPRAFASWLRPLFRHDWVVYSKRPFGGPEHVLRYLGAYTHRVAISNNRLVALSEGNVTFRWRDSAHGNKKRLMTLPVDEFLRRFLLHSLPRGFMRIRNFGFLANRQRAELLPLCSRLLQSSDRPAADATSSAFPIRSLWQCPLCGGNMQVVERLSAAQLLLRSPPHLSRCAA